jgi:hypothetical protein
MLPAAMPVEPAFRLGSLRGDSGVAFGELAGLGVNDRGEVLVLDRQAAAVLRFDTVGRALGAMNRPGKGPGELVSPSGLHVDPNGHVWVSDPGTGRLTEWVDGEAGRTFAMPPLQQSPYIWKGGVADGVVRIQSTVSEPQDPEREPAARTWRGTVILVRWDVDSGAVDTLLVGPSSDRGLDLVNAQAVLPFQPERLVAGAPDGSVWTATSDAYDIVHLGADGDTLLHLRARIPPVPVDPAERAARIESLESFMERVRIPVDVDWDAEIPDAVPPLSGLAIDEWGRLWVQRHTPAGLRWDVFTPEGEWRMSATAALKLDGWLQPVVRNGWFAGMQRGEFDEPYVVVVRMPEIEDAEGGG